MRNAIVTGGSRGLGLGIAQALAEEGYSVVVVARRSTDALDAARANLKRGAIHFTAFDLADIAGLGALAKAIRDEHGAPYALVNNAGLGTSGVLATMHVAQIEALVRLNITAPLVFTKYVVRAMMARGEGRVVNMTSIVAASGFSGLSVYGATKASLVGFTKSLAREVGPLGVTVNAVAPGFVATDMTAELGDADRDRVARRSALRRLPEVADVAAAVVYLLSEGARNVTGTVLTVDAGSTA